MTFVQKFEFPTEYGVCTVKAELTVSSPSWAKGAAAQSFLKEIREKLDDALKDKDYS